MKRIFLQFSMGMMLFFSFALVGHAAEIVIDYGNPGYSETGTWQDSGLKGYNSTSTRYSNVGERTAQWTPTITEAGEYEVFIYKITNLTAGDKDVDIEVVYDGGSSVMEQDWTIGTSGWVSLGKYPFAAGTSGYVIMNGEAGYSTVYSRADAVKFVSYTPPPPEQYADVGTYYVDAVNGDDANSGMSEDSAWKTLDKVNTYTYRPGSNILLKSGGYWIGQLKPKGSGAAGSPIVIDSYGSGNKPIIDGNGIANAGVVHLVNQEYWEINNLEVVNDAPSADSRFGIYIELKDYGTANHIYVRNCYVHNIKGDNSHPHRGVGIFYFVSSGTDSKFNDILIENNTVKSVDRSGIILRSPDGTFSTGLVIRNNMVEDIGGDGIVAKTSKAPLVEYNIAKGTSARANNANAAIWTWYTDDAVVQYNESYDTVRLPNNLDANGFDSDFNNRRSLFQYNYSHNNGGGFILLINPAGSYNDGTIVRYNISQNDGEKVINLLGYIENSEFYNNTFYLDSAATAKMIEVRNFFGIPKTTTFKNNIFYNLGSGGFDMRIVEGFVFDTNIFYGGEPPAATADADISIVNSIIADPKFVNPGSGGSMIDFNDPDRLAGYRLQSNSPAINAGLVIEDNGGKDFWGNPLYTGQPDIGAHEYDSAPGPGTDPGTNPGTNPGTDPGTGPGTGSGTNPGTDTDHDCDPTQYTPQDNEIRVDSAQDGQSAITVIIDEERLARKLKKLQTTENDPVLQLTIPGTHALNAIELPLSVLNNHMEDNKAVVIRINSDLGSYDFPLSILSLDNVISGTNTNTDDASLIIRMDKATSEDGERFDQSIAEQGLNRIGGLVDFKIILQTKDKEKEIHHFGNIFVKRIMIIDDVIEDVTSATAVVFDPVTGQFQAVPSVFTEKDGKTEVAIVRNTNSLYGVVHSKKSFQDMIGHWAAKEVEVLASKLIVNGTTDQNYMPNQPLTRAQFAALLLRGLGLPADKATNAFVDVSADSWYALEVNAAAKYGLVQGAGDGRFNPDQSITREQMVTMLMRAVAFVQGGAKTKGSSEVPFADGDQVSSYARQAVVDAVRAELIAGKTTTTFAPQEGATRAQAAVMIYRALQYLKLINE
ncbi:hypothetical protein PAT3040_03842 [Paenibacillus agaridevorans]|uniref:SLH domain-containing protein n=1 Tax=Paenibacillus agaridevorans TaxID=171404 RepID=A0A2R5ER83_9BACL|nr:S-layer homology domain-containing protein [Paenibacillus agaridevorans]GBG09202.1 hypothetical protein PAT3040_03842 [Paenibacillus agaridevorans]